MHQRRRRRADADRHHRSPGDAARSSATHRAG
nr:MAG TPA_asm: hypothetical protein [Caudoviricetes sp.]